ncbi:MAG: IS30 family transposase [Deltaproteobacteria bacterium]|nr:IS30 family transposase [Deltaproteobacteria bacterium]
MATHLTLEERYQIQVLLRCGSSHDKIARSLDRSRSTIDREIKRNRGSDGPYLADRADALARARLRSRARANARKIDPGLWASVHQALAQHWSPEQIAGRLRLTGSPLTVSHESIYAHVYADKRAGGLLWKHLACQKKRRRRHGAGRARRHLIPNRVAIDQRPAIVEARSRFGDWEGDTLADRLHRHAVVTLVERRSMYIALAAVPDRTTDSVCTAIISSLQRAGLPAHTLTLDNGAEFCAHARITETLGTRCYFAKPYAAWQRGLNENHNGLVRRYIPKKSLLANYTQAHLSVVADRLNNRPRKKLGYLTPLEFIDLRYFPRSTRALRS